MSVRRIVYLPMDSRPCNYSWPGRLAGWAGAECTVPDIGQMDEFRRPAEYKDTKEFLLSHAERADAFVISVDHLCYGSLLASRSPETPEKETLQRLELLRRLKKAVPDVPIYAFSIIMRSSLSTLCAADLDAYRNMTAYSYNRGRETAERERGNLKKAAECRRAGDLAESRLPAGILKNYHAIRQRNFAVNAACARMLAENVLDRLELLQEDSEPYGFHKNEQRNLETLMKSFGIGQGNIRNGADEAGMVLVSAALYGTEKPRLVHTVYTRGSGRFTARYEDRPFAENVRGLMYELNLEEDPAASRVLVIHTPRYGRQKEAQDEADDPAVPRIAEAISKLAGSGKKVYLLDVAYANGGSRGLVSELTRRGTLGSLAGYAAWNTASNSLGTSVAQMLCDDKAGCANRNFMWERILDDMLYQRVIRPEVEARLTEEGLDCYNLPDRVRAEQLISEGFRKHLSEQDWPVRYENLRIRQPWPRTFETDIRLDD